jgi:hypothetical protein
VGCIAISGGDVDIVEKREVGSGEKIFQVSASTLEPKRGESRKDRACHRMLGRWMPVASEFKGKFFELGQRGQTSDNFLG